MDDPLFAQLNDRVGAWQSELVFWGAYEYVLEMADHYKLQWERVLGSVQWMAPKYGYRYYDRTMRGV